MAGDFILKLLTSIWSKGATIKEKKTVKKMEVADKNEPLFAFLIISFA